MNGHTMKVNSKKNFEILFCVKCCKIIIMKTMLLRHMVSKGFYL